MKAKIKIHRRIIDKKVQLPLDIPPLLRRIYASRGIRNIEELELSIKKMLRWNQLLGIEKAVFMLYKAFKEKKKIVIIGDFDTDGATSTALSLLIFRDLGYEKVSYLMPNRFENGYGLSLDIVKKASICGAKIIMTVDNGILSYEGVNYANQLGIQVLITDHHLPGSILPNAEAIINPNLKDCDFPSKALSGSGVAFYLMLALRNFLLNKGWFKEYGISIPNLAKYLDLVALGTIADVLPMDGNNRILIWQGIIRMRSGNCRPGIKAILELAHCNFQNLVANDLSFVLVPRLNAAGRLKDMSISVALLLCNNLKKARILAHELNMLNQNRKKIEKKMQSEALRLCKTLERKKKKLPIGLAIYHSNWHQGVVGILASRIKDQFYRPVIAFAPTDNGILKGSGRSIQGLHMHNALTQLDMLYPGLIMKFGGHAMAVGLSLEKKQFKEFQHRFDELVKKWVAPSLLEYTIISDGPLTSSEMTIEVAQMIRDAGPWGTMFPEPIFDGKFHLLKQQIIGGRHLKVIVGSAKNGPLLEGIAFNIDLDYWPDNNVRDVELTYTLNINEFRGNRRLQIIINNIWPI